MDGVIGNPCASHDPIHSEAKALTQTVPQAVTGDLRSARIQDRIQER